MHVREKERWENPDIVAIIIHFEIAENVPKQTVNLDAELGLMDFAGIESLVHW